MSRLDQVHKALQKKANRELSEQFVKEIEDKIRAEIEEEAKEYAVNYWVDRIGRGLAENMQSVMLLVLHDKDGFGTERGLDRLIAWEKMWEDIEMGRISQEDVDETVRAEMRIAIEADGIYKILKNGEMQKVVNFSFEGDKAGSGEDEAEREELSIEFDNQISLMQ